ncbi:MAG: hypothetical protein GEV10_10810 [Streptosporangiales bacterium]|nr:hypothetical protein [Streptosporangiales bacterium]
MSAHRVLLPFGVAVAASAVLLAGCGGTDGAGGSADGASSSASTSVPATSATEPSTGPSGSSSGPEPSEPSHTKPTVTGKTVTITGTAVRGVEPGCVGLRAKGKTYELAGDEAKALAKGGSSENLGKVRVTGRHAPKGMVSHCMMGEVFVVTKLTKL